MSLISPFQQGLDQYIKRVNGVCYDCRPTVMRPLSWYCDRHLVAGFANTRASRHNCNCEFVNVGDCTFLRALRDIANEEEIYVFYKL